ncbi:MAG: KH domain-containing protein [Clostridiales bacterium]|jgi:predicted RNA-binding protein YlqC (UPF0109 family)|nr:KH domain-containing protein [Clostridiales bacterium]
MTELLEYMVKSIVKNPDDVTIASEETERGITLHLKVNEADMGQVIGKEGRIINSLRSIIKSASRDGEISYSVEVDEPTE